MRYIITEIKNTPEGINRLCDTEEWTCNLEDRVVEIIEDKQEKGKKKDENKGGKLARLLVQHQAH